MYLTQLPTFEIEILKIIGSYSENEFILGKNNKVINIKYLCNHCETYQIQENYQKFIPKNYQDFNRLMENIYSDELRCELPSIYNSENDKGYIGVNDTLDLKYILCIKCFTILIHKPILGLSSLPLIVDELDELDELYERQTFSDNETDSINLDKIVKQHLKSNDIKKINNLFFEEKYKNDMKKLIKKHDYKIYDLNTLKKFYEHFNFKRKKHLKDSRIQYMYLKDKRMQRKKRKWNFLPKFFKKKK
jgi:hypothetical protein